MKMKPGMRSSRRFEGPRGHDEQHPTDKIRRHGLPKSRSVHYRSGKCFWRIRRKGILAYKVTAGTSGSCWTIPEDCIWLWSVYHPTSESSWICWIPTALSIFSSAVTLWVIMGIPVLRGIKTLTTWSNCHSSPGITANNRLEQTNLFSHIPALHVFHLSQAFLWTWY